MSRRRYLSTDISTDPRVVKLAKEAGEFAALLYTWMIPHAADDATLTGDPEELLFQVAPGFRWKEPEDVARALDAMLALGLIERAGERIRFPESFYKHQTYIKGERRGTPQPEPPAPTTTPELASPNGTAHISAKPRTSPQPSAESRPTRADAQFSSSFSSSVSFSSPVSTPDGVPRTPLRVVERTPVPKPAKTPTLLAQLIDRVRARDPDVQLFGEAGRNGVKLKDNEATLDLDLLAEAIVARAHGEWTTPYLDEVGGAVWAFIGELGKYVAWKRDVQRAAVVAQRKAEMDVEPLRPMERCDMCERHQRPTGHPANCPRRLDGTLHQWYAELQAEKVSA